MAYNSAYLGKQIGNYRITGRVASGSFGTVFLAQHVYLKQRSVVIKILHELRLGSQEEQEQFLQEAQILEMLKGLPHVLPLLDVGLNGDIPYLIAEYAEQGSLRMRMRQHNGSLLPLHEALSIVSQVGFALQHAHDKHIVHRDLKPENILFNAKGEALLADFGISTMLSTASVAYTRVAGTPAYMAPEQFRGEVSKESDQYSLACIAYELLTGRKPFDAQDFIAMGFLHSSEMPEAPSTLQPHIPHSVEMALFKALSKKRSERYPNVHAFIEALNHEPQQVQGSGYNFAWRPGPVRQDEQGRPQQPLVLSPPSPRQQELLTPPVQPATGQSVYTTLEAPQESLASQIPLSAPRNAQAYPLQRAYQVQDARNGNLQTSQIESNPLPVPAPSHVSSSQQQQLLYKPAGGDDNSFLQVPLQMKRLAGFCYLLPLVMWLVYLFIGRKNRFARFHYRQAVLLWGGGVLGYIIFAWFYAVVYNVTLREQIRVIFSMWNLLLFVLLLLASTAAFFGKYFKIPFLARRAQRYADKAKGV